MKKYNYYYLLISEAIDYKRRDDLYVPKNPIVSKEPTIILTDHAFLRSVRASLPQKFYDDIERSENKITLESFLKDLAIRSMNYIQNNPSKLSKKVDANGNAQYAIFPKNNPYNIYVLAKINMKTKTFVAITLKTLDMKPRQDDKIIFPENVFYPWTVLIIE